jgi:hypothetical protein
VTYAELVAAIKGYAENDFPATAGSFSSTDQLNTLLSKLNSVFLIQSSFRLSGKTLLVQQHPAIST